MDSEPVHFVVDHPSQELERSRYGSGHGGMEGRWSRQGRALDHTDLSMVYFTDRRCTQRRDADVVTKSTNRMT